MADYQVLGNQVYVFLVEKVLAYLIAESIV